MLSKRGKKIVMLSIIILVFLVIALYLYFFHTKKCSCKDCFDSALKDCKRVSYVREDNKATWKYEIKGERKDECVVEVNLLRIKEGILDVKDMEGHGMTCYFPKGVVLLPESDLSKCHGLLKEDLQALIIKRAHQYILKNLGKIKEEFNSGL